MPRAEDPIEGDGPVQQLARELLRIREQAGKPAFRKMAKAVEVSHTALAAAAHGTTCPTWRVTRAFAVACGLSGDAADKILPLWEAARGVSPADRPQPDDRSPARYAASLGELRAWTGRQTRQRPRCENCKLPTSTLSDALRPKRTTLPTLRTVKLILVTCLDDEKAIKQWLNAYSALAPSPRSRHSQVPGGGRPAAAGTLSGGPAAAPPRRCVVHGCGAPEWIWDWKPSLPPRASAGA